MPLAYSATSLWPFISIGQNAEAGRKKERDISDASCLLGVMEHTSELFSSPWSPKVSIKRQITGNSCTAPSTEITYAYITFTYTVKNIYSLFWWLWIHVVMDSMHLRSWSTLILSVYLKPLLIKNNKIFVTLREKKGSGWRNIYHLKKIKPLPSVFHRSRSYPKLVYLIPVRWERTNRLQVDHLTRQIHYSWGGIDLCTTLPVLCLKSGKPSFISLTFSESYQAL